MKSLRKIKESFMETVKQFLVGTPKLDITDFPPTTNEEYLILSFADDIWGDEPLPVYVIRNKKHPIRALSATWECVGGGRGKVIDGVAYIDGNQGLKEFGNTYVKLIGGTKETRTMLHAKMREAHII
jgi:hypothetical protein